MTSSGIQAYVVFMEDANVGHKYAIATYIYFISTSLIVLWQTLRSRSPGRFASAKSDDLQQHLATEDEPTARDRASILSILCFSWVRPFIQMGRSHVLTQKDWPKLNSDSRAFIVNQEFETVWYEECAKREPSLFWVVLRLVWWEVLLSGIYSIVLYMLTCSIPVWIYLFMTFIENKLADPTLPTLPGFLLASSFAVVQVIITFVQGFGRYEVRAACIKIESALINQAYRSIFVEQQSSKKKKQSGDIINLISSDIARINSFMEGDGTNFNIHAHWVTPIVLLVYMIMLWKLLGVFGLIPLALFLTIMFISKLWGRFLSKIMSRAVVGRGERSVLELDVLRSMRTVKMASWGRAFRERLISGREHFELPFIRLYGQLTAFTWGVLEHYPVFVGAVTFGCFAKWSGQTLTPAIMFSTWQILISLEIPMKRFHFWLNTFHNCLEAIRSIETYLHHNDNHSPLMGHAMERGLVRIENGSFAYDAQKEVLTNIKFRADVGQSYCLIGRVGSGKSSFCKAILDEITTIKGKVYKSGSIAYAAQKPWIFNGTIKDNIVFGNIWDPDFYAITIDKCALRHDLDALSDGDESNVGEEGVQLSGGQKARISLARAVYARADIYIIDDVLAAVDQHTARHLNENVIGPDGILGERTRILVSNHLPTIKLVDHIALIQDGTIAESCTPSEVKDGSQIQMFISQAENALHSAQVGQVLESADPVATTTNMVVRLNVHQSLVDDDQNFMVVGSMAGFRRYLKYLGPWSIAICFITMALSFSIFFVMPFFLAYWAEENVANNGNEDIGKWFGIGMSIFLCGFVLLTCQLWILLTSACKAASLLYTEMITALFRSPMQFFDSINAGQIMNRLSGDLYSIDTQLGMSYNFMVAGWVLSTETLIYVAFTEPLLIIIMIICAPICVSMTMNFLATTSQVKRSESVTRGALFGRIKESSDGLETIRAYNKSTYFATTFETKIDTHMQTLLGDVYCKIWLRDNIRFVGAIFVLLVPVTQTYSLSQGYYVNTASVGVGITILFNLMNTFGQLTEATGSFCMRMIALDRCFEYADLPSEHDNPSIINPTAPWPSEGKIEFRNFSIRYRDDLDLVLKNINLRIEARQRIGVVGRTGAGKSSLIMALFRIVEAADPEGAILIDGIDIRTVSLDTLRKNLAIIPQDAALFKGTMRYNLDLENKYTDKDIWQVLEKCQLKGFVEGLGGLDAQVEVGGKNFSQGQRQLVSIARAFLNECRVLVLDEATASVDSETDMRIQEAIKEISRSRTVITIAHRINTVLDSDRIVVLADGRIIEEGRPADLLVKKGEFWELAKEAGVLGRGGE